MPDLYGFDASPLATLNDTTSLATLYPQGPSAQDYYNQFLAQQQQQQAQRPAPAQAAAMQPTPAPQRMTLQDFISWPAYQQARSDVDPAVAYQDYVSKVLPAQLQGIGHTRWQADEVIDNFKKAVPPPEPKVETVADKLSGAWTAIKQGITGPINELEAAKALVTGDKVALAEAVVGAGKEAEEVPEPQKRFSKLMEGGTLWSLVPDFVRASVKEPIGLVDATLNTLVSFVPFMGASMAGGVAAPVTGGAYALGTVAGGIAISQIRKDAVAAGIDPNNEQAVAKFLEDGGEFENIFGKASKGGMTNAAITMLTMAVAHKLGAAADTVLQRSGMLGAEEAAGKAGTLVGPVAPAAMREGLRQQGLKLSVKETAANVGGFATAGAAGDFASGETPEAKDVAVNALTLLLPSLLGMRGRLNRADRLALRATVNPEAEPGPEGPPSGGEPTQEELFAGEVGKKFAAAETPAEAAKPEAPAEVPTREARAAEREAPMTLEEQQTALEQHIAENKLDSLDGVRGVFKDIPKLKDQFDAEMAAVVAARDPAAKMEALEALAQAGDDKRTKYGTEVANRAQTLADELRNKGAAVEVPTLQELVQTKPEEVHNAIVATQVANDIAQESANAIRAEEAAKQLAKEQAERQAQTAPAATTAEVPGAGAAGAPIIGFARTGLARPAAEPTVPTAAKLPTLKRGRTAAKGAGEPAGNVEAVKGAGNLGQEQVGTPAGAGVNAQVVHAGATLKPRRGKSARGPGGNVEPAAAGPVVPRGNEPGKGAAGAGIKLGEIQKALEKPTKLRAGRAATEEANRKAEADIKAALESERQGRDDVDQLAKGSDDIVARKMSAPVQTLVESGNLPAVIEHLARSSSSPTIRYFMRLTQRAGVDVPIRVVDDLRNSRGAPVAGSYRTLPDRTGYEILIDGKYGDDTTVAHEIVHAATHDAFANPRTAQQRAAIVELQRIYEQVRDRIEEPLDFPAIRNAEEFLAETFGNSKLQELMRSIEYEGKTLWDKIKILWAKLIGAPTDVLTRMEKLAPEFVGDADRGRVATELNQEIRAQHATDQAQAENAQQTPHDAILGLDEEGNKSHIAYRRGENDYDLYPITDRTTKEGLRGNKNFKQTGLSLNQVHAAIREDKSEPQNTTAGFDRIPGNDRDMITRWKAGPDGEAKLVYAATRDTAGDKWTALTGEDLQSDSKPYTSTKLNDRAAAIAESHKYSDHASKVQAENVFKAQQMRNLLEKKGGGELQVTMPSAFQQKTTEAGSPIRYLGRQVEAYFKVLNDYLPKEWNLNVQYLLRNSDMEHQGRVMLDQEATPLIKQARSFIDKFKLSPEQFGGFIGDLTVEHRNPLLRAKYVGEARYADVLNPQAGESEFYKRNVRNEQEATARLNAYEKTHSGFRDELRVFMDQAKKFSDATVDMRQRSGVLSATTAAKIKAAYKIYAPLGTKKSRNAKATGQSATAEDPIEKMITARLAAIAESIDNKTKGILLQYARTLDLRGDDGQRLFKVTPIEAAHLKHDVDSGEIKVSTALDTRNSFVAYENGVPTRVEVTEPKLLKAIDSFSGAERDTAIQAMLGYAGFYTRMFGALHTSLSIPFAHRNFVRDYVTNLTQLDPRIGYGAFHRAMFSKDTASAAFRLGFQNAAKLLGKDSLAGSPLAIAADKDGAMIEHRSRYGVDQVTGDIRTSLAPTWSKRGLLNKGAEYLAPSSGKLTNFISGMTHSLEAWNRIAVYRAALESGIDHQEAASLAKMATTNFELRGSWMPYVSPFYAFANAKMQGARTMAENLGFSKVAGAQRGGFKQGALGLLPFAPKAESANLRTIKAAQLMLAIGLLSGYANYMTSPKNKAGRTTYGQMNEYQLDEYLHIPGTGISIPVPQEIGSFFLTGNTMADQLWGDRAGSASTPAMRFITGMIQNFWPGGTSMHDPAGARGEGMDYFGRLVTPTPLIPFYDIAMNTTSFGQKVNPLKGSPTVPPEYQQARYASPAANILARAVPASQMAPPDWDHIFQGLFGQQGITEKSIVTNGLVGGLLQSTFRSFHQQVFPGTTKMDYDQVAIDVAHGAYRAKGGPLKKGEGGEMKTLFDNTTKQIKALDTQIGKLQAQPTPNDEQIAKLREREDDLRSKALKHYYETTGVITAQQ